METTFIVGTNRISGCTDLVSLDEHPLLKIETDPIRVTLTTPQDHDRVRSVQVRRNKLGKGPTGAAEGGAAEGGAAEGGAGEGDVRVIAAPSSSSVFVFMGDLLLVSAVQTDPSEVHISLDLRPIGIAMHSDSTGLYIGDSHLVRNVIKNCATAFNLR